MLNYFLYFISLKICNSAKKIKMNLDLFEDIIKDLKECKGFCNSNLTWHVQKCFVEEYFIDFLRSLLVCKHPILKPLITNKH